MAMQVDDGRRRKKEVAPLIFIFMLLLSRLALIRSFGSFSLVSFISLSLVHCDHIRHQRSSVLSKLECKISPSFTCNVLQCKRA